MHKEAAKEHRAAEAVLAHHVFKNEMYIFFILY